MNRRSSLAVLLVAAVFTPSGVAAAQPLPSPLGLADVIRLAAERRDEMRGARARTKAGEARPAIVSALPDPMISPSLDHLPFMLNGADYSVAIEQQIPLSGVRGHRRASSLAELDRLRAEASRTSLDVSLEAANAFLMLQERRRTASLVDEQIAFARDVVNAANARYASGTAPQSDVLRAEVEVARLEAAARALVGEVRGAEAMLNTSLALDPDTPVPPLTALRLTQPVPSWPAIRSALRNCSCRQAIGCSDGSVRDDCRHDRARPVAAALGGRRRRRRLGAHGGTRRRRSVVVHVPHAARAAGRVLDVAPSSSPGLARRGGASRRRDIGRCGMTRLETRTAADARPTRPGALSTADRRSRARFYGRDILDPCSGDTESQWGF
jgi:hypothetical protein